MFIFVRVCCQIPFGFANAVHTTGAHSLANTFWWMSVSVFEFKKWLYFSGLPEHLENKKIALWICLILDKFWKRVFISLVIRDLLDNEDNGNTGGSHYWYFQSQICIISIMIASWFILPFSYSSLTESQETETSWKQKQMEAKRKENLMFLASVFSFLSLDYH